MEQIYAILVASFFLSKYFSYDNNFRIIILIITYPLLALNCYNLSLKLHTNKKLSTERRLIYEEIFQIILFSLVWLPRILDSIGRKGLKICKKASNDVVSIKSR